MSQNHRKQMISSPPRSGSGIYPSGPLSCSLTGRLPPRRLSHPGTGGPEVVNWWPRGGELVAPRRLESDKNLSKFAQNLLESAQDLLGPATEFQTSESVREMSQNALTCVPNRPGQIGIWDISHSHNATQLGCTRGAHSGNAKQLGPSRHSLRFNGHIW